MLKKNFKGRCVKRSLPKCKDVCKTYSDIQFAYADVLQANNNIIEIKCNIPLDNEDYTTDFVCIKKDNDLMIRECVRRNLLTKPLTIKLLDISKSYWNRRGVSDWGIVVNEEK